MMAKTKDQSWQDLLGPPTPSPIDRPKKREPENWAPPLTLGGWHLAQVATGQEKHLVEYLRRQKFGVYFPQVRMMRLVPKKLLSARQRAAGTPVMRERIEALLPGYLFVHFHPRNDDRRHDIFQLGGIRGLCCNGDPPTPYQINPALIDGWLGNEVNGCLPGSIKLEKLIGFAAGDHVKIIDGPFRWFDATVEEVDATRRATLLVNIFGRLTPVSMEHGQFEKV